MIEIRRVLTHVEDVHHEFGPPAATPLRRGWLAAVLTNPFAGRYEADILPMMDALNPVGLDMARRLLAAMDVPPETAGYDWKAKANRPAGFAGPPTGLGRHGYP